MFNACDVAAYLEANEPLCGALGLLGSPPVDVCLLARGEYNQNFIFTHPTTGQSLLFRVNLGSQMQLDNQIAYEANALFLLKDSGRTPHVLFVDDSKAFFGKGILVEEFLPGRPLDYTTDLTLAAQILADIHSVPVPEEHGLIEPENPLQGIVDECSAMFSRYRSWSNASPHVCARVDRWFKKAQAAAGGGTTVHKRHIISTELNSGNFLINEDAPSYLIDWEKPLYAEVEQDLAHFLVPTTTFWKTDTILSSSAVGSFVEHYRHAVGNRFDTSDIENRLPSYCAITCLRGITWCAMALAQHEGNERKVADVYTLEKIKEYLEEPFLTLIEEHYYS